MHNESLLESAREPEIQDPVINVSTYYSSLALTRQKRPKKPRSMMDLKKACTCGFLFFVCFLFVSFSIDYRWCRWHQRWDQMLPRYIVQHRGVSSLVPELSWRSIGGTYTTDKWSSSSVPFQGAGCDWGRNTWKDTGGKCITSAASRFSIWQPCLHWHSWRDIIASTNLGLWLHQWAPLACQMEPSC